ncbi:hypothetical protein AMTRI_Chr10g6170 [Amborella trichopoda]
MDFSPEAAPPKASPPSSKRRPRIPEFARPGSRSTRKSNCSRRSLCISKNSLSPEGCDIRLKVRRLQTLVPGGHAMGADRLYLQTADYILFLKLKLSILQALSKLYTP